ncbi:5-carboxymethyl-2-hydroxymuconate Delta-isomerase [Acinetobacter sp. B51(2017)]|uniref:5-carboxymethyl-2-hydroxymuconate Delta-isomerase n=1 Tax=Acinetobacter sp. B51(2017) TaxID=2060938 RepID=UPI000F0979B9|nr:5-carboxymethyl-2-hydroxymuconate Delta-isomerase [Acinetobacter sp. B51(2017)]
MPHIHVEYSANVQDLAIKPLLLALNQAMLDGAYVKSAVDVKSRAIRQQDFVIGLDAQDQGYVHVKVSLLNGRSLELKSEISRKILSVLQDYVPVQNIQIQLCVEILEMDKTTYSKNVISI